MTCINEEELRRIISIETKNAHALESYYIESGGKKSINEENIACLLGSD